MVRNERYPNTERYPSEHLMCQAMWRGRQSISERGWMGRSIENRSISRYRDLFLKMLIIKSNRGHVRQPPSRCGRHATLTLTYAPDSVAPCASECGKIVSPARISYAVHICADKYIYPCPSLIRCGRTRINIACGCSANGLRSAVSGRSLWNNIKAHAILRIIQMHTYL